MAQRYFLDKKTHRFFFTHETGKRKSYVLIYGDEVEVLPGRSSRGRDWIKTVYRQRHGEMKNPRLTDTRALEFYFLDVGQGDAAFIVTPDNIKILVDGGLRNRALGFLIWKYRLDRLENSIDIDYLILSHGDIDHVEGLVPILRHPRIRVRHIIHNGIALFRSGFNTALGNRTADNRLTTLHSTTRDLEGLELDDMFRTWIQAVTDSGASYRAIAAGETLSVGTTGIELEILGPVVEGEENAVWLPWFQDKAHTINGHSIVFRLCYDRVRTLFSGDLNVPGARRLLLKNPSPSFDAHIFKAPHHGSHEFHRSFFQAVRPMITVVSSGDSPDHGHPRALFLGCIGLAGRSTKPLLFSTEIAATFKDFGTSDEPDISTTEDDHALAELDYSTAAANVVARHHFKKILPGIINVRTDGRVMYAARRVQAGYQWESYGPIKPVE